MRIFFWNRGWLIVKQKIKTIISDIRHKTSHTIEFVRSNCVEDGLSAHGIKIRRIFASILRWIYRKYV